MMRRALAIAAALCLALVASGQSAPPSAEASWASLLLVLGGLAGLIALLVGGRAAWRIVSAPIQTLDRLEQIVVRPVEGSTGLVERVKRIEDTMASADDLDALRAVLDGQIKAQAHDHAASMALLRRIHAEQRRAAGLSADDPTEG